MKGDLDFSKSHPHILRTKTLVIKGDAKQWRCSRRALQHSYCKVEKSNSFTKSGVEIDVHEWTVLLAYSFAQYEIRGKRSHIINQRNHSLSILV